jgi:hypothetical protein
MIGGWRLAVTAATTALCVSCSASPAGPVSCAPCPSGQNVEITGVGPLDERLSVCVSGLPCARLPLPRHSPGTPTTGGTTIGGTTAGAATCGVVSCSLDGSGVLRFWLHLGDSGTMTGRPVRVTVTGRRAHVARGSGVMRHAEWSGPPCRCSFDRVTVAVA